MLRLNYRTHSSKDADNKHVDEEGDGKSNGGLDGVVLDALLHLHRVPPRDGSALRERSKYHYSLAFVRVCIFNAHTII